MTVENVGDVDGRFVGALNRVGPLVASASEAAVVLEVGTGGTERWTFGHDLDERPGGREDPTMWLHLLCDDERVTREVDVDRRYPGLLKRISVSPAAEISFRLELRAFQPW